MQSTKQTDLGQARLERDRVLNSTYLRDQKDREEAVQGALPPRTPAGRTPYGNQRVIGA